jgi:site-specific recombinase XerD
LKLERSLSGNSIEAYSRDIEKLAQFAEPETGSIKTRKYYPCRSAPVYQLGERIGYDTLIAGTHIIRH